MLFSLMTVPLSQSVGVSRHRYAFESSRKIKRTERQKVKGMMPVVFILSKWGGDRRRLHISAVLKRNPPIRRTQKSSPPLLIDTYTPARPPCV